ncbi:MAG TPA: non-canonical purine NTP pyrophosphatase [Candidatus Saccharimonadales bacterium]|nr:non-canonical purine NTP pyrophosphatase [Candidatus Saccharimonadales bacterium]
MPQITFVTGNAHKLSAAQRICSQFGVDIAQAELDIVEIQGETGEPIARDKAQKAYDILQKPLVVTDDTWMIPALGGFPGPYMKSVNHWFGPQQWLDLTARLQDKTVILRQIAVYQDEHGQQLFTYDITGRILDEARGPEDSSNECVVSFNDEGLSSAEMRVLGRSPIGNHQTVWHEFAPWLAQRS